MMKLNNSNDKIVNKHKHNINMAYTLANNSTFLLLLHDDTAYFQLIALEKQIEYMKLSMREINVSKKECEQHKNIYMFSSEQYNSLNTEHLKILKEIITLYDDIIKWQNKQEVLLRKKYNHVRVLDRKHVSEYNYTSKHNRSKKQIMHKNKENYLIQYVPKFCNKFFTNKYNNIPDDIIFRIIVGTLFTTKLYADINAIIVIIEYLMHMRINDQNNLGMGYFCDICGSHQDKSCDNNDCVDFSKTKSKLLNEHYTIMDKKENPFNYIRFPNMRNY